MPTYYQWRSVKKEKQKHEYPSLEVTNHPLRLEVHNFKQSSNKSLIQSLQKWSSSFEELDPLLRFEQMDNENNSEPTIENDTTINYSKIWGVKRTAILNKYTTGEKLTIISSYLPGGEKTLLRQVSNLNEKVKHRLEQLDDFDESSVRKTMGLSQKQFVTKINMLDDEIKKAWETEQRVKAFKIAIQCSKLLSDISVMQFYPSKFVLISDVLDHFGTLVFDRLMKKSFGDKVTKLEDIESGLVPESARETCQNWMFKMASIRELLPRLYMEMSLLKCYVFISKDEIKPAIARLTTMIRGIGNSLVAIYVRVYLCKVASALLGRDSECFFHDNLKEFLEEYQQIFQPAMAKKFGAQLLTADKYLSLYVPAIDWLLHGTLNTIPCKLTLLDEMLQLCDKTENSELLLHCLVSGFDSPNIIKKSPEILEIIKKSAEHMVLLSPILCSLGEHLCHLDEYRLVSSETLSQTWWKLVNNIKSTENFLQVLEPWIQFACTQLSVQHINMILRGVIRYLIKCGKPIDKYSSQLELVLKRMLKFIPDVEELFLMDAFMPLVELVQTTNARSMMSRTVLIVFFERCHSTQIEDHIIIACLMRLCCIIHEAITAVTVDDELKLCADLIQKFIQRVYYPDPREQLNFYVECRSAFIKLDCTLKILVSAVHALANRPRPSRSRWLSRACAAYCFVTVPSLDCGLCRAQLYLLGAQAALLVACVGQAEANLKAFVSLVPDIPLEVREDGQVKDTHLKVNGILSSFLSTLIILPDNVDCSSKAYILSGFIKAMERVPWKKTDPLYYAILLKTLDLLCNLTQEKYIYRIEGDKEFIDVIENHATHVCQELLVVLKELGDAKKTSKQYYLALELFWRIIKRGDLKEGSMTSLAFNLWVLSQKVQDSNNNKFGKSLLSTLERDTSEEARLLFDKLNEV